jgi:hypothetical protein
MRIPRNLTTVPTTRAFSRHLCAQDNAQNKGEQFAWALQRECRGLIISSTTGGVLARRHVNLPPIWSLLIQVFLFPQVAGV